MLLKGSFEDILYILIGIIWVVFSIYQAKKKKKQKSAPRPDTEKKKSLFETLLDEVTENQQQTELPYVEDKPIAETVTTPENEYEKKIFTYDDYYEKEGYKDAEEIISANEPSTQHTLRQELKSHIVKSKKQRFDLQKAIIYSEILNPKYF